MGEAASLGRLCLAIPHRRQSAGDRVEGLLQPSLEKVSTDGQQRKVGPDQWSPVCGQTLDEARGYKNVTTQRFSMLFLG